MKRTRIDPASIDISGTFRVDIPLAPLLDQSAPASAPVRELDPASTGAHESINVLVGSAPVFRAAPESYLEGMNTAPARIAQTGARGLTARETEVYRCAAEGLSNAEIATVLFISESTVKTHMSSILAKLNLKSRSRLVAQARAAETTWPVPRVIPRYSAPRRFLYALGAALAATAVADTVLAGLPAAEPSHASQDQPTIDTEVLVRPFIAQVMPIELAPLKDDVPLHTYMTEGSGKPATVVDSTYLGEHDIYFAIGLLSEEGRVCLALIPIEPDAHPDVPAHSQCTSYGAFTQYGLEMDKGSWGVHWFADGTTEWEGSSASPRS